MATGIATSAHVTRVARAFTSGARAALTHDPTLLPSGSSSQRHGPRTRTLTGAAQVSLYSCSIPPSHAKLSALSISVFSLLPLSRQRKAKPNLLRASAADVSDPQLEIEAVEETAMEKMEKTLENVRGNFNSVRTGRASPSLLDRVEVEYYGTSVTLKSIAQVSTPDASTLLIAPFDKSSIPAIEKSLLTSDIGLTPNSDGNVIRLSIPQLTQERRKELIKTASKLAEEGKVALRNIRRDSIKAYDKLQKEKKISDDDKKGFSDSLQKMTDEYVKQVEELFKKKEKDLLTV